LFCSLLFTAFAMAAGFAHVFEMPNKITLKADEYLIVQQIYRGWSLLAIVVLGSLFSTLALTVMARRHPRLFRLAITAFLCIVGTQVIFWLFTYPVNQQTRNWTILPENWMQLRKQWEYSHAAGAALDLSAFIILLVMALSRPR
jgi:ABC-type cobalamin transport system permease subunit